MTDQGKGPLDQAAGGAGAEQGEAPAKPLAPSLCIPNCGKFAKEKALARLLLGATPPIVFTKVDKRPKQMFAFVEFATAEQRDAAMQQIPNLRLKGRKLRAEPDGRTRENRVRQSGGKRSREDGRSGSQNKAPEAAPRSSCVHDIVTPLWRVPYDRQLHHKHRQIRRMVVNVTRQIRTSMVRVLGKRLPELKQPHHFALLPEWIRLRDDGTSSAPTDGDQWHTQSSTVSCGVSVGPIVPSPGLVGTRNKLDATVGPGLGGGTTPQLGFRLGTCVGEDKSVAVARADAVLNLTAESKAVLCALNDFLAASSLPMWHNDSHTGVWRGAVVRHSRRTGDCGVVILATRPGQEPTAEQLDPLGYNRMMAEAKAKRQRAEAGEEPGSKTEQGAAAAAHGAAERAAEPAASLEERLAMYKSEVDRLVACLRRLAPSPVVPVSDIVKDWRANGVHVATEGAAVPKGVAANKSVGGDALDDDGSILDLLNGLPELECAALKPADGQAGAQASAGAGGVDLTVTTPRVTSIVLLETNGLHKKAGENDDREWLLFRDDEHYGGPVPESQRAAASDDLLGAPALHPATILFRERILGRTFEVSPAAFFQTNTRGTDLLFSTVGKAMKMAFNEAGEVVDDSVEPVAAAAGAGAVAGRRPPLVLLDVCCGTGTIGIALADQVDAIVGVDIVPSAIEDAQRNARDNGIARARYVAGPAEQVMDDVIAKAGELIQAAAAEQRAAGAAYAGAVDWAAPARFVAVVDPPRAGLHQNVLGALRSCEMIDRVVYVSCNPLGSLVKDLVGLCTLKGKAGRSSVRGQPFQLRRVTPADMFPHTLHVEAVSVLDRLPAREAAYMGRFHELEAAGGGWREEAEAESARRKQQLEERRLAKEAAAAEREGNEGGAAAAGDAGED